MNDEMTGSLEPTNPQLPTSVVLLSWSVSHRYREVTGSNLIEVLNFSGFHPQLQKFRS